MVIWTGYGFLVVIAGMGLPLAFFAACSVLGIYDGFLLPFSSGLIVAGVFSWCLGRKLHRGDMPEFFEVEPDAPPMPEKPPETHTVYFIRIEYWGIALVAGGLILLTKLIRNGELWV